MNARRVGRAAGAVAIALAVGSAIAAAQEEAVWRTREEVAARAAEVLAQYADRELAAIGVLDVTKAPYNADPTGTRDCTRAIQQAVEDARDARLICYFPAGDYRVSDTIRGVQGPVDPRGMGVRLRNDDYPCVLWGAYGGEQRARLVLADRAPGFGDAANPKPVVFLSAYTWRPPHTLEPNVSFNQMILSLDVSLGDGNSGAVGIDHQAAQGAFVEDVTVDATGAFAGFRGAPGSGGSMACIEVQGGRYGLYLAKGSELPHQSGAQPSPVMSCVALVGQTERAIVYMGRGPLTLTGSWIEGAGIELQGPNWGAWNGALNIVDSTVLYGGTGAFVTGNRPVFMSNVYVENADPIVELDGRAVLAGNPGGWMHVAEFAAGGSDSYPVWVDGQKRREPLVNVERDLAPRMAVARRRHQWLRGLPLDEVVGAANVRAPAFGAAGDGETDDTVAIQNALDSYDVVFLPKGVYRTSAPLRLRADNKLIGLGVYSVIRPIEDARAFSDPTNPQPVIYTDNDSEATTALIYVDVYARTAGAYALHWQAGRHSTVRNCRFKRWPWADDDTPANHPFVLIDGNGGGSWYNLWQGSSFAQGPDYRHFLVKGTRQQLDFYMFNPEHAGSQYQAEFIDVENVSVYAIKAETLGATGVRKTPVLRIAASRNFRIFGHGGIATASPDLGLYIIDNCTDYMLTNFCQQHVRMGDPPDTWSVVVEHPPTGGEVRTPATEWFVLYQRGTPPLDFATDSRSL
jgi:hypothetical protein